jgi:hypothetical protein
MAKNNKKKKPADETFTVRFTVKCSTNDSLSGMVQTEDQGEQEERVILDDSGVAEVDLPAGEYTFVWAVKMTPIKRHRYSIKAERIPDDGDPVVLRKRPNEQTTTEGEDVGFDVFTL